MNTKNRKQSKTQDEPSPRVMSPAALTPESLAYALSMIGDEDLMLCFDIRVLDKEGEVFQVKGNTSFPQALRQSNKPAIPIQFQRVVTDSLLSPLFQRFNDLMQEDVENTLPPPPPPMSGADLPSGLPLNLNAPEEDDTTDSPPDQGTIP
jgi:hypothetical protein